MGGETIEVDGRDWRAIAAKWLVNQGVPTILLFLLLGGVGHVIYVLVPQSVTTIQAGYDRMQAKQDEQIEKLTKSQERQIEATNKQTERLLEVIRGQWRVPAVLPAPAPVTGSGSGLSPNG